MIKDNRILPGKKGRKSFKNFLKGWDDMADFIRHMRKLKGYHYPLREWIHLNKYRKAVLKINKYLQKKSERKGRKACGVLEIPYLPDSDGQWCDCCQDFIQEGQDPEAHLHLTSFLKTEDGQVPMA